jgi:hypothetical protein
MEDIRLGRRSPGRQVIVSVATSDGAFVPYAPDRTSLIVQAPLTNRITLSFADPAVADQGIVLYPQGTPLVLDVQHHGALVHGPIRAISDTAAQTVAWWETSLEDR